MPNEQLDQDAVNLAKSIRQVESGAKFDSTGKSGEHGAYQFMPKTWDNYSQQAGVKASLQQATPEQQNEVAYKKIKAWKDKGYNPGQIASMWNAGEGRPNAYLEGNKGTNSKGVSYDTAAYAKQVAETYQSIKGQSKTSQGQSGSSPADMQSAETTGASFPAKASDIGAGLLQGDIGGAVKNVATELPKAIGNIPSSFLNLGKGLASAALHPIDTITGVGKGVVGGIENLTGKNKGAPDENQQTANAIGKAFLDRYGSLENAQRTATNDPAGVGADILSILEGGTAGLDKLAGTATNKALNTGLTSVARPIASSIKSVASAPFKLAAQTMGLQTGVGATPITEGFKAASQGGEANKAFLEGLRGNTNPDELVTQARDALDEVSNTRGATYKDMLAGIKADPTTYDISPIEREIQKQFKNFNVGVDDSGALDFSRSKLRFNTSAQSDIQKIVDTMKDYGLKAGDRTAAGIDNLKQAFGELDKPSSSVRAFTTAVTKATRGILDNTPGYTEAMKNYADMSDNIDTIRKSLSLGDTAMAETTFKKLTSALKNNDFRNAVLQSLDEATGGQLVSKIAGQRLSSVMPRGLAPYVEGGLGGVTALVAGASGILPILGMMITSSPRVVGEFVHALGVGARGTNAIMNVLNKFSMPTTLGAGIVNRINLNATSHR